MSTKRIVMHYTTPPSLDDLRDLAKDILDSLPADLLKYKNSDIQIDDFPDGTLMHDLDMESDFDLLVFFSGGENTSLLTKAPAKETLYLFRRPFLDAWCDIGEDLSTLLRQTIIQEIAMAMGFEDNQIEALMREEDGNYLSKAS